MAKAKDLKCGRFIIEKRLNSLKKEINRLRQMDKDFKSKISVLVPDVSRRASNLTAMREKFTKLYANAINQDQQSGLNGDNIK